MRWRKIAGVVLTTLGCAGFATVADDLRHAGELFGVGGVMMMGVMLVAADSNHPTIRRLALHWVAAGFGLGLLVGVASDSMQMCVAGGGALGALASKIASARRQRAPSVPTTRSRHTAVRPH